MYQHVQKELRKIKIITAKHFKTISQNLSNILIINVPTCPEETQKIKIITAKHFKTLSQYLRNVLI